MQVAADGTITIPLAIRRKLGITESTKVEFVEEDGKVVLTVVKEPEAPAERQESFDDWLERVKGMTAGRLSTDEIMQLTRGDD